MNVFVPQQRLQEKIARNEQANMLLVAAEKNGSLTKEKANEAIRECWRLADMDVELRRLEQPGAFEIRSKRVFIDEALSEDAKNDENILIIHDKGIAEIIGKMQTTSFQWICRMMKHLSTNGSLMTLELKLGIQLS